MTKPQRTIITHLHGNQSITWIEATEILEMPITTFLETVGELVFQGFLTTTQRAIELKPGQPSIVNIYTLTAVGKRLLQ